MGRGTRRRERYERVVFELHGGTWFGSAVLQAVFSEGGLCGPGTAADEDWGRAKRAAF